MCNTTTKHSSSRALRQVHRSDTFISAKLCWQQQQHPLPPTWMHMRSSACPTEGLRSSRFWKAAAMSCEQEQARLVLICS